MEDPTNRSEDAPIAIVGFGHFGRALAELMLNADVAVRAWDPTAAVPSDLRADTPSDLVARAEVVVVATPVGQIRAALTTLKPLLSSRQLVLDVGSVKVGPVQAMTDVLGNDVEWVGTHPLFGPTNIARGERPLRAVVCPNPLHPKAAKRARRLYEQIGCQVIEQAATEHDRVMARTHAMAFFIAKGLIDIGATEDLPFSPPSFQALGQTIDSVRSDAGHLFLAIERDNPFAAEARQALLDALAQLHGQLEQLEPEAPDAAAPQAFTIPDLGDQAPELMETRDLIDEVDVEIVQLLVQRGHLANRAGRIKSEGGRAVRDRDREQSLLEQRRQWAKERGLSEESVTDIFSAILRFSRKLQSE
ncbi:MAG: prephenate dehydrogenase/arogenate dehydrogenase family protein [Acidimicrobiia bacterium]